MPPGSSGFAQGLPPRAQTGLSAAPLHAKTRTDTHTSPFRKPECASAGNRLETTGQCKSRTNTSGEPHTRNRENNASRQPGANRSARQTGPGQSSASRCPHQTGPAAGRAQAAAALKRFLRGGLNPAV